MPRWEQSQYGRNKGGVGSGGPWGRERPIGEEGILVAWLSWDALPAICYGRSYRSTARSKGSLVWTFSLSFFPPSFPFLPSLPVASFASVSGGRHPRQLPIVSGTLGTMVS